jgi:hypothetical protein
LANDSKWEIKTVFYRHFFEKKYDFQKGHKMTKTYIAPIVLNATFVSDALKNAFTPVYNLLKEHGDISSLYYMDFYYKDYDNIIPHANLGQYSDEETPLFKNGKLVAPEIESAYAAAMGQTLYVLHTHAQTVQEIMSNWTFETDSFLQETYVRLWFDRTGLFIITPEYLPNWAQEAERHLYNNDFKDLSIKAQYKTYIVPGTVSNHNRMARITQMVECEKRLETSLSSFYEENSLEVYSKDIKDAIWIKT